MNEKLKKKKNNSPVKRKGLCISHLQQKGKKFFIFFSLVF